jgi:hypothetical protein
MPNPVNYTQSVNPLAGSTHGAPSAQSGDVGKLLQDLSSLIDGQQNSTGSQNDVSQFLQNLAGILGGAQHAAPGASGPAG